MLQKGFIGPIGDDLPSLIPIVIGLVIFFSIFVMTLNTYNDRNDYISKQIDMTSVARSLKGDSLILNWDQFSERCDSLSIKRFPYSFAVAIYSTNVDLSKIISDFSSSTQYSMDEVTLSGEYNFLKQPDGQGNTRAFYCNYKKIGGDNLANSEGKLKKEYFVRFYPVAVQQPILVQTGNVTYQYLIVPAVMAMVVWE